MLTTARARRRKRDDRLGLLILLASAGLAALVGGTYVLLSRRQPQLNPTTLCPVTGPHGLTVLLVDRTQPLSPIQQAALRQEFGRIKDGIAAETALEIYSIGPVAADVIRPDLPLLCSPRKGASVSEWTGNPRMAERQWHERFERPVAKLLRELAMSGSLEASPILESLQSVAVTALSSPPSTSDRRLIVASDMLQNTAEFSQYRQAVSFSDLRTTQYYKRVRADLRGVDVEIIYIRRDGSFQDSDHIRFWQDYFADVGARLIHVKALSG